jgi:hypothetical protein
MQYKNQWKLFLKANEHLLNIENRIIADKFLTGFDDNIRERVAATMNIFCLDGWHCDGHWAILQELMQYNRAMLTIPVTVDTEKASLLYNTTEGWCNDSIFNTINTIVELCGLNPDKTFYINCSANVNDVYQEFCAKNNVANPIKECICVNGYDISGHGVYQECLVPLNVVPFDEKKLFCTFNWNPWDHRLGLIALLHYHDLIDDGYVTSPGVAKFRYDQHDFEFGKKRAREFLAPLPDCEKIMEKFETLRERYPLKVDDRTQYSFTDQPIYDQYLKAPIEEARENSLFEVVAETKFEKEHFYSEKTFYPVHKNKPFMVVNSQGAMAGLKRLQYKTYAPFIDESYDNEPDAALRTQMVVEELVRLKKLRAEQPDQFRNNYLKMMSIANINRAVLRSKKHTLPTVIDNLRFKV